MKNLSRKFRREGDLMMVTCAGSYHTAKVCMQLDKHTKFVGCDLDSDVLSAAEPDLL